MATNNLNDTKMTEKSMGSGLAGEIDWKKVGHVHKANAPLNEVIN